ncbi:hypothetical protein L1049_018172 [Liquidambar formosana]|uniref:RING-type E3 ubiquitin transferase n=1 Tax=Liquidambar formosana TaxID=63359 RepID=A0AAP0NI48_LIQFO
MGPHFPNDGAHLAGNSTAVAIDKDKNSQYATRWAIEHLLSSNSHLTLVHVRPKNINHRRKFRTPDVAAHLTKSAPDFCSVYVIAKGKAISVRMAQRPAANTAAPPRQPSPIGFSPQFTPDNTEQDDSARGYPARSGYKSVGNERTAPERSSDHMRTPLRERPRSAQTSTSMESIDLSIRGQRFSAGRDSPQDDIDFSGSLTFGSMDMSGHNLDFSAVSESPMFAATPSGLLQRDIEAEMKRLKLELKQTMDLYSTACKEAISAKKKTKELNAWKLEEARKFEEARNSEEAALAIAEMEKAKCKAAIEAAEVSQRLAEMEAQRRRQAELKAKREAEEKNRALNALAQSDVRYRKYTIQEIETATKDFTESMKIGEGGYGPVYKGYLDHTPVAIKVLRPDAAQGRKQFQQEVEVLSSIRHPNMVLLLGACPEYGCLVYEYMSNGSLEDRLFQRGNSSSIPWRQRFKIAAEIATALLFLHQAKPEPLVHRDLKPANILLDRNYVSKISDVGLARLVPPSVANSVTQYHMTSAAGTFCYIDPEYQQTGMLTIRSDIYSLGILLLQIITAKPPMGLSHHVDRAIEKGKFAEMLDPTVPDWPVEEAMVFAKLALKCAELRKKDRPDLGTVVLPELNRLRDLGKDRETSSNGYHAHSHGSLSNVSSSRSRFSATCEESTKIDTNERIEHSHD